MMVTELSGHQNMSKFVPKKWFRLCLKICSQEFVKFYIDEVVGILQLRRSVWIDALNSWASDVAEKSQIGVAVAVASVAGV